VTSAQHGDLVGAIEDRLLVPTSYPPPLSPARWHHAAIPPSDLLLALDASEQMGGDPRWRSRSVSTTEVLIPVGLRS
jgi:hypothetical protein